MQSIIAKFKTELNTMHAVCKSLAAINTNAGKGHLLIDFLTEYKFLVKYFRAAYQEDYPQPPAVAWALDPNKSPSKEQGQIARRIFRKDLLCGLTAKVVTKAFEQAGLKPLLVDLPKQEPRLGEVREGIQIDIHSVGDDVANGSICIFGNKVGTLQLECDKDTSTLIRELRRRGVVVNLPKYLAKID